MSSWNWMDVEKITNPARQFDEIAFLYDELMASVPYKGWLEYIECILKRHDSSPRTALDLCCGTGTVSRLLAERGYRVSGVDISPKMIEIAKEKALKQGMNIEFKACDAASFRLGKRFDLVLSLFDSLNYILESSVLQNAFYRVSEHLERGGLFLFDMNTEVALAGRFFDQNNLGTKDPVLYDWRSSYDGESRLCSVRMDFFYRLQGERKRVEITHFQRAYHEKEISEMLENAGLSVLAVYDAYSFKKSSRRSDRVFYVARK